MVSDGNADFVGDVLWLDPRAPNMCGTLPGTINHLFKTGGSHDQVGCRVRRLLQVEFRDDRRQNTAAVFAAPVRAG